MVNPDINKCQLLTLQLHCNRIPPYCENARKLLHPTLKSGIGYEDTITYLKLFFWIGEHLYICYSNIVVPKAVMTTS